MDVKEIKKIIAEKIPEGLVVPEHTHKAHYYRHVESGKLLASVTTMGGILESPHLKMWAANMAVEHIRREFKNIKPETEDGIYKAATLAHKDIFEDAGDIGTQGHNIIEDYLKTWIKYGEQPTDITHFIKGTDSRLWAITRSAEKFFNDYHIEPIASELFVASVKHGFGGTLDSLMMVKKILKKGKNLYYTSSATITQDEYKPGEITSTNSPPRMERCKHDYWNSSTTKPRFKCQLCGEEIEMEFALVDFKTSNQIDKPEYAMQVSAYWQALYEMTGLRPKKLIIVRFDKKTCKYEVKVVAHRASAFRAFKHVSKVFGWLSEDGRKLLPIESKERIVL